MSNLDFDFAENDFRPLAARMRPTNLEQYYGQTHLIGEGKPLRKAIQAGHVHSMILWGPPGTGKTTLAEIIAHRINAEVERISAVTSGMKEIRESIERAKQNRLADRQTILFVDEVHRFNKSQQDAFLPHIEDGTIIFIGATTENPSFELNNALLSRARVYLLKSLTVAEIEQVLQQAISDPERGLGKERLVLEENLLQVLAEYVNGDARLALNCLELMVDMAPETENGKKLDRTLLKEVLGERQARFDKQGDRFYDLISALHKSIRGSAADAALYWYARIITAGGDPLYVARRLLAIASEDVGNADPNALQVAVAAAQAVERIGMPEARIILSQAALYVATAPKSNACYMAIDKALDVVKNSKTAPVPVHLQDAHYKGAAKLGHGTGYKYAHDYPNHYVRQQYLPDAYVNEKFYEPGDMGYERDIKKHLDKIKSEA